MSIADKLHAIASVFQMDPRNREVLIEAAEKLEAYERLKTGEDILLPVSREHAESMYATALAYIHADIGFGSTSNGKEQ